MDAIDKVRLMAELSSENCSLNHGPGTENDKISAADYLVIPFGYAENDVQVVAVRDLVIPVCFDCALALKGDEWTLLYCFECANSRWVCRKLAKNNYRHHILWMRGCPDCTNKFGGLYFTDVPTCGSKAVLAVNEIRVAA
jgi:hypothetical protein